MGQFLCPCSKDTSSDLAHWEVVKSGCVEEQQCEWYRSRRVRGLSRGQSDFGHLYSACLPNFCHWGEPEWQIYEEYHWGSVNARPQYVSWECFLVCLYPWFDLTAFDGTRQGNIKVYLSCWDLFQVVMGTSQPMCTCGITLGLFDGSPRNFQDPSITPFRGILFPCLKVFHRQAESSLSPSFPPSCRSFSGVNVLTRPVLLQGAFCRLQLFCFCCLVGTTFWVVSWNGEGVHKSTDALWCGLLLWAVFPYM